MIKQLYLIRHAEAVNKSSHQADVDRELTPSGVQQAFHIGTYLSREQFLLDAIFSSTAERARQTAALVAETMKLDAQSIFLDEALYEASTRTFLQYINRLDNAYNYVMCVGHNPTISYLAEYLTKAEIGDLPPAGAAIIRFDSSAWTEVSEGNGNLVSSISPDTITMK